MFGHKKKLEEAPLYYWEEKSYMMIILPAFANDEEVLRNALKGIEKIKNLKVIDENYSIENNCINLKIEYEDEDYEVGYFLGDICVPEYYLNKLFFTEKEREELLNAKRAVTIFMKFRKNVKKSYHLQLKLAVNMVPNLIGILDESAEKLIPRESVLMQAKSKILPSSKSLFTIQAVVSIDEVWYHTHGLCRCGLTELEILKSNADHQKSQYNLLSTFAMFLIDKEGKYDPTQKGAYLGRLINGTPIVATYKPWTEGIQYYKNLKLGGKKDRKQGHNSNTSVIFLYTSEENEKNGIVDKISVYDNLWEDNPIFFISDEETQRMKETAIEKFNYLKKGYEHKDYHCLVKIGLPLEEKGQFEHIWFELLEIKGNKFKAKLTQEPYYFDDIHEGYINWYTVNDITDWVIYTPEYSIIPDTAFLLDDES